MTENKKLTLSRSQQFYVDALLALMQKKPYTEITVSELSEYAQYDRRTYYRHFKSKDDVLCLYCASLLSEMAEMTNQKGTLTPQSSILSYFEFWSRHKDFLTLLDRHHLLHFLGERLDQLMYQYVGKLVQDNLPEKLSDTSEFSQYAFYFTQGGLWFSLVFWIRGGMKLTPRQLTEHILTTFTEMQKLIGA